jgi:receptor-type tyrosine-protein phosphatase gamma
MVWDHNSQTVVVLSDTADDDFQVFWPLKQADVEFENFRVRFIDEHKIQLPEVGNHPAHPDEYVTQIEVAAQSLQVITYWTIIFHKTLSNVLIASVHFYS